MGKKKILWDIFFFKEVINEELEILDYVEVNMWCVMIEIFIVVIICMISVFCIL